MYDLLQILMLQDEILRRFNKDQERSRRQIGTAVNVSQWKVWSIVHLMGQYPFRLCSSSRTGEEQSSTKGSIFGLFAKC